MQAKINFNGQEYSSLEEMPPEIRQAYEQMMNVFADQNQNGVPDLFESMAAQASANAASFNVVQFNGQTFGSMEQMPPEARQAYEQAMNALNMVGDRNQNGVPDILEGVMPLMQTGAAQPLASAAATPIAPRARSPQPVSPSVMSGDVEASGRNLKLLIFGVGLVLILVLIAGGVALLMFNQYFLPR